MIAGWLKAGVFEAGKGFAPTEEGTPQGGIISPLLLNVALHGLEEASGVRYSTAPSAREKTQRDSPVTVAYADDFVVCCHSRQQAESIRARLAGWLAERGLSLNEDKTRIVHLSQGFDFLGWNFRRYPVGKTLVKPSKGSVAKHRQRLADEMRRLRGSNAGAVIGTLNPVIRGAGPPITAARYPARHSPRSGTTPGSSPGSGQGGATREKEPAGPLAGTTGSSARPGKISGSSATGTLAPTC